MQTTSLALTTLLFPATRAAAEFAGLIERMKREARTAAVKVIPLPSGLSMIENAGGNITVLHSAAGTLLVDSGISEQYSKIMAALGDAGAGSVTEVINTHWHFDHIGGNARLHTGGARLTAHENTLKNLRVPVHVTPWQYTFQPMEKAGQPSNIIHGDGSMDFGGQRITIHHVKHAHTDGDLVLRFEQADILSTGDIFWNGHYPFIDYETGGSIDGMIAAVKFALTLSTTKTIIVPGHGALASVADLQRFYDMLHTVRNSVMELKKKGMSLEEIVAERPTAKFDGVYGNFAVAPAEFVALVYQGVCCGDSGN